MNKIMEKICRKTYDQQARMELLEHYKQQFRLRRANDLKEELTSLRLTN